MLVSKCRLHQIGKHIIPNNRQELRAFLFVCNEKKRLPYILDYHRKLGIQRFFIVDNMSDDGTVEYLLGQTDVHLFQTHEVLHRQDMWRHLVIKKYDCGNWWLCIDADELFMFPGMETRSLYELTRHLDREKKTAMPAIFLDMYSKDAIGATQYSAGEDPRKKCAYFDPPAYRTYKQQYIGCTGDIDYVLVGGMRERVFGKEASCMKFPLVKYKKGTFLPRGLNYVEGADISSARGCIMHFKYFCDFITKAEREASRNLYWNQGEEYKRYNDVLKEHGGDINLWFDKSIEYEGPSQLIQLGIMYDITQDDQKASCITSN